MIESSWDLLRSGRTDQGLRKMRDAYSRKSSSAHSTELAVAYLWVGHFEAAWEHLQGFIETRPNHSAIAYGMSGAAKWCLNEPAEAVNQWRAGLRCDYADGAGGVKSPLLLFFASVAHPELVSRSEAERLLVERADDPRARNWPGPLAKFVLGRIDESQLRSECVYTMDFVTEQRRRFSDFWEGVVASARGTCTRFLEAMQRVAGLSWNDFDLNRDLFLSMVWQEEFFLARHESLSRQTARG